MLRIERSHSILKMSDKNRPAAFAASGDVVIFETFDCFSNKLENETQLFSSVGWQEINPATGPLYVEGAKKGDVLKVDILDVNFCGNGVTAMAPGFGVFGKECEEVTRVVPVSRTGIRYSDRVTLRTAPMIGVIGTAPADGREIDTGTPGEHGGNMDCRKIAPGSSLYLPVHAEGALLAMGDMHAAMGDGEVSVCGIEAPGEATVRVTALKNTGLPLPLLLDDSRLMTLHSARTLDEAAEGAARQMQRFMTEQLGLELHEAAMLLSAAADLCICQVVDPLKTCRMELPLDIVRSCAYPLDSLR